MLAGFVQVAQLNATFSGIGSIFIQPADLTSFTSGNTSVIQIDGIGRLVAVGAGSALITATLGSQTQTATINVTASAPDLKNRWSFNEAPGSTTVVDSQGGASGTIFPGATGTLITRSNGEAIFPNAGAFSAAPWIRLPNGIISTRTNITIEFWSTWTRTAAP